MNHILDELEAAIAGESSNAARARAAYEVMARSDGEDAVWLLSLRASRNCRFADCDFDRLESIANRLRSSGHEG